MNHTKIGIVSLKKVKYPTPIIWYNGIGYLIQGVDNLFHRSEDSKGTAIPIKERNYIEVEIHIKSHISKEEDIKLTSKVLNRKFLEILIYQNIDKKVVIKFPKIVVRNGAIYSNGILIPHNNSIKSAVLEIQHKPLLKFGKVIIIRYNSECESPYSIDYEGREVTIPEFIKLCQN